MPSAYSRAIQILLLINKYSSQRNYYGMCWFIKERNCLIDFKNIGNFESEGLTIDYKQSKSWRGNDGLWTHRFRIKKEILWGRDGGTILANRRGKSSNQGEAWHSKDK